MLGLHLVPCPLIFEKLTFPQCEEWPASPSVSALGWITTKTELQTWDYQEPKTSFSSKMGSPWTNYLNG